MDHLASAQQERSERVVDDVKCIRAKRPGEFLFTGHRGPERSLTTRQYARLVLEWIGSAGLDPRLFGTHSLRRTKATSIAGQATSGPSSCCSERRHTAHEHLVEGLIYYRFHPRFGETVLISRQLEYRGVELVVVLQPDRSLACIPAWMTRGDCRSIRAL